MKPCGVIPERTGKTKTDGRGRKPRGRQIVNGKKRDAADRRSGKDREQCVNVHEAVPDRFVHDVEIPSPFFSAAWKIAKSQSPHAGCAVRPDKSARKRCWHASCFPGNGGISDHVKRFQTDNLKT